MHCGEAAAILERRRTYADYTVTYCYTGEAGAIIERIIANAGYTIAYCYAGEAGTILVFTTDYYSIFYR